MVPKVLMILILMKTTYKTTIQKSKTLGSWSCEPKYAEGREGWDSEAEWNNAEKDGWDFFNSWWSANIESMQKKMGASSYSPSSLQCHHPHNHQADHLYEGEYYHDILWRTTGQLIEEPLLWKGDTDRWKWLVIMVMMMGTRTDS